MLTTDEQSAAVASVAPILVVTARAGSGKTATMAERIRQAVANGTHPRKIVAITYTVAAGRELAERLERHWITLAHCGTLHSFAMRHMGTDPKTLASEDEATEAVRAALAEIGNRQLSMASVLRALDAPSDPPGEMGLAVRAARALLRQAGKTTFAMVLTDFLRALQAGTVGCHVPDMLIVDEAQDTAEVDAEIFETLKAGQKTFVGDPQQAIYGFRGCSPRWFQRMARRNGSLPLSLTFRCRAAICEAANRLFPDEVPMRPAIADTEGRIHATHHQHEAAEDAEIVRHVLATTDWDSETVAVLTRYNRDARRIADRLAGEGCRVILKSHEPAEDAAPLAALRFLGADDLEGVEAHQWREALGKRVEGMSTPGAHREARKRLEGGNVAAALYALGIDHLTARRLAPEGISYEATLAALLAGETPGEVAGQGSQGREVTVGTIHSAKGREWDTVLVARCQKPGPDADLAEERRLFYVAITRARFRVEISSSARITGFAGGTVDATPSPFISDAQIPTTNTTR